MTREMGKVINETRGDVQEAIDAAYYKAGEGRRLFGPTVPSELPNKFAMAVRQPLGVCGMITPWNFPMAISSWKLLPALVCGQYLRDQAGAGHSAVDVQSCARADRCGIPEGVINIVTGFGAEVGTPMAEHTDVRAVSLTGSTAVGRIVGQEAAQELQALLAGVGRQESDDRARRREPRSRASKAGCGARSAPPASAAPPPAASSCRRACTGNLSIAWSSARRS